MLDDGRYDAMVVDASDTGDGSVTLDLTLLGGNHKGEVVTVHARSLSRDVLDLLGLPATLTVEDGQPSIQLDDGP